MGTMDLEAQVDLLALIGGDTPLRRVSSTAGGEWCGPCPFCGGRDRFRVHPAQARWWCRQCSPDERWEDAIAYLRRRDHLSFRDAREQLDGGMVSQRPLPAPLRTSEAPAPAWQAKALQVVQCCSRQLWASQGDRARAWLHARGLEDGTLARWQVGYSAGQELDGLWVPRGIVLPWFARGEVWQLKVRRPVTRPDQPKYASVKGGRPYLYGRDHLVGHDVIVLAEGEFDAMLLWQTVRHRVDVATLGSCSGTLSEALLWELMPYRRLLVAYDRDEGGERGALRLQALSGRMERIVPLAGVDVTDFHLRGGSLVDWVQGHLTALFCESANDASN